MDDYIRRPWSAIRVAKEHAELLGAAGHGDVGGWTYRKDWFARPDVQKDFKAK